MQGYSSGKLARARRPVDGPLIVGASLALLGMTLAACVGGTVSEQTSPSVQVIAAWTHPELRDELLEMMAADQLERTGGALPEGTPLPPSQDYVRAVGSRR